ncbi:MAG TPA: UDP-N-acetylmuramoyl-tripeptide--D-alanyl-D-alanine ligase [Bacteroidales bacterium]|nr:UDP-N-acetylmuramoyl-tripeptide--D-alanyl-D-alanine ligase [Bacteroidales bacterium]HOK97902.1 UDP-N-acetylmuramoyl-tripeptide--D-alanyl-D-alanine ligase [Bacteroidales bacterium]HPO64478.1 UDP-N-acetylmuramoyl-tripeptide--D-alanyl-D-alanine ligase [Bacteroidales bacterium]
MNISELYQLYLNHPQISTDTRVLPEGCIFFALKGEKFDGNAFADQALQQGAAYVVIDNATYLKPTPQYILVSDTLATLQELARFHRQQLKIPFIGITGSNGKTTTKELINAVLSKKYKTYATKGNLNNHIGVPLTILAIQPDIEIAIIEMGANHIGEIDFLCSIAQPNYGLITNIGKAHLEGFGSFEGVIQAKTELYRFVDAQKGTILFSIDNQLLKQQVEKLKCQTISYGHSPSANIRGYCHENNDSPFMSFSFYDYNGNEYAVRTALFGKYNFENAMAAVSFGLTFGVDSLKIVDAIESYQPKNNRSQLVQHGTNRIICDFYNANPSSMENAIENFAQMAVEDSARVIILGEMKELGPESEVEHQKIIQLTEKYPFDRIFLVGKAYHPVNSQKALFFEDNISLIHYLNANKISNSYVLIKGSRGAHLEEVYQAIFQAEN